MVTRLFFYVRIRYMLQSIREKAQGWIAWVILGMIAITFVLWGVGDRLGINPRGQAAAEVNGDKITMAELDTVVERLQRQQSMQNPELEIDVNYLKQVALQNLIEVKALQYKTQEMGLRISDDQLKQILLTVPEFQENGAFSQERLNQFLKGMGYTQAAFLNEVRTNILVNQLQKGIVYSNFSLAPEAKTLIKFIEQKRDVDYVVIPASRFSKTIKISDADIDAYYKKHAEDFVTEEKASFEYLVLNAGDFQKDVQPTEDDLKGFYQKHIAQYTLPEKIKASHILIALPEGASKEDTQKAEQKAKDILAKLKAGEDFSKLAQTYSDDTGSGKSGGELGTFGKGEMVPEFEKAAFALKKPGELSGLVRSQFGIHIIKLAEKFPETHEPFEKLRTELKAQYIEQKSDERISQIGDEISTLAYEQPDSLQPIADKFKLKINQTEIFSQDDPKELFKNPKLLKAVFSPEVLQDKHNSELIKIDDKKFVVARVNQHNPAKQKALETVKNDIVAYLTSEQAQKQAKALALKMAAELDTGKTLLQVAQANNLSLQSKKSLVRKEVEETRYFPGAKMGIDPAIAQLAFSLPKPVDKTKNKVRAKTTELSNGDTALVTVNNIIDGKDDSQIQNPAFMKSYASSLGQVEFNLLIEHVLKTSNVKNHVEVKVEKPESEAPADKEKSKA